MNDAASDGAVRDRIGLPLAATLVMMIAIQSVSVDTVFPAISAMRHAFDVSPGLAQVSVSVYIVAFAATQLVYGPLSDRWGRRPVVLATVFLYAVGGVVAAFAASFETLLAGRFIQGIGGASAPTIARAVVRDVCGPRRSGAVLSYLMSAFGVIAVANPVIGGALTAWFGWSAVFLYCALFGATIVALVWLYLRETLPALDPSATDPARVARNYLAIARHRRFVVFTSCSCGYYAGMFVWLSGGVFALIEVLGVSADVAGVYFGLSTAGFIIGAAVAGRAARRFTSLPIVAAGAIVCLTAALTLTALALAGTVTVASLVAPAFVYMFGLGGALAPAQAASIAPFPHMAGAASSLIGFVQMVVGAAAVAATGYLFDGSVVPMALLMAGASVFGLLALLGRPGPVDPVGAS